jgi:triphosphoribosyl-dephospho-CoA synthase
VSEIAGRIAAAFTAACRDELHALKPGNVHIFADGHRMTATDFIRSAEVAAPFIAMAGACVGSRILRAVEATRAAVGTNTNLGIILLCAPLALAAEQRASDRRAAVAAVLDQLDVKDAALAFRAIVLASPGGLGTAERHDVRAPAAVSLKEAMAAAAGRDRIAHQYASAFADVFETGETALEAARARWRSAKWATLAVYLAFLSAFADTHVARKHGASVAEEVRRAAGELHARLQACEDPAHLQADLLAWDASLKERHINPGTSADLTVATLFVAHLRDISSPGVLPSADNNG